MNRSLKTLLLWLIIAALPIQGLAAAMQASCGSAHHGTLSVTVETAGHHLHGAAVPGHDDSDVASVEVGSNSSLTADQSSTTHQEKSTFCSACAACCVGAIAPPSAAIFTPTHSSSELFVTCDSPSAFGFFPAGLERPPKIISA